MLLERFLFMNTKYHTNDPQNHIRNFLFFLVAVNNPSYKTPLFDLKDEYLKNHSNNCLSQINPFFSLVHEPCLITRFLLICFKSKIKLFSSTLIPAFYIVIMCIFLRRFKNSLEAQTC